MFICAAFKSKAEWSYARVSVPTTMILPTIVGMFYSLNCFIHMLYVLLPGLVQDCTKSWQQHPTRHQLYGHLPPITKTIQVRRTRHAGHCWRSRDELIRDVLLWIPTHGRAKAGRPARTYIQQLCEDTGCCPEDLPRAMNDREEWRERVWDIRATSAIWWWWWYVLQTSSYLSVEVVLYADCISAKEYTPSHQWVSCTWH